MLFIDELKKSASSRPAPLETSVQTTEASGRIASRQAE